MSGPWRPIVVGYAAQLANMSVLFLYHFLLPVALHTEAFADLVVVTATGGVIVLAFDAGFNLMTVRRPALANIYLGHKLRLLAVCSCGALLLLLGGRVDVGQVLWSILYALVFTFFTHGSALLIGTGRYGRSVYVTVGYGILLTGVPVLFGLLELPLAPAPVLSTGAAVLLLSIAIPDWRNSIRRALAKLMPDGRVIGHLIKSFVRQLQLSAGPFMEGLTTSGSILFCAMYLDSGAVASARVAFSMAAVMGMTLPFNRQYVFAAFSEERGIARILRLALGVVLVAGLQALLLLGAARLHLIEIYPPAVGAFAEFPWILLALPAVRVVFELAVIAADRLRVIRRVLWIYMTLPVLVGLLIKTGSIEVFSLATYFAALSMCLLVIILVVKSRQNGAAEIQL